MSSAASANAHVDAMTAKGFVDESRLVAAGGSYGGYLAAWLLGKTDRFAAIVDHAGARQRVMAAFKALPGAPGPTRAR